MKSKNYYPYLAAIALFVIITLIHFNPLLKGKVINQFDITQHKGMSKEAVDYRKAQGKEALWTNSMFGGMPAYQISPYYSGNLMSYLDRLCHLFLPHPSGYIFMGFAGFFILLLCLEISPWLALVGGLAYGFSSYFFIILEVGHNSKSNALGYLPPLLGGLVLLMRQKYRLGFAVTLLFSALELNANHVQISYYGYLIVLFLLAGYFVPAWREKKLKPFFTGVLLFATATFISILPNAGNLLTTYEYGNYTTRGRTELTLDANLRSNAGNITSGLDKQYAMQYSYGIDETFTFLIPNYKGGASGTPISYADKAALKQVDPELREQVGASSSYFGVQDTTAGAVYLGAIVMFLAFMGVLLSRHPLKWPLLLITLLAVILSWGKYFAGPSNFFMDYVPGYNKFRAVSMILIIAELTIPLLAVLGLSAMLQAISGEKEKKALFISAGVVGGFCLLAYLAPDLFNTFSPAGEESELADAYRRNGASDAQISSILPSLMSNLSLARKAIFKSDALRSFIFILLTGGALFLYLDKKLNRGVSIALLAVFIGADMWPVGGRYLNKNNFVPKAQYDAPPAKSPADERILADTSLDYRVLNLTVSPFQDATTSYYHKSIGGYHGAKLKKYDELISFHLFKEINRLYAKLNQRGNDSLIHNLTTDLTVLNMLNTRYIILSTREEPIALLNNHANGNAWLIKELKVVNNADSELTGLYTTDTKTRALIQKKNVLPGSGSTYEDGGKITLRSYQPNHLVYEAETNGKAFAVFSEIYYPKGWSAYVDGVLSPYACVDYLLRGMEVPAGKHRVEFKFEPLIYKTGNSISLFGSLLVLAGIAGALYLAVKRGELSFAP